MKFKCHIKDCKELATVWTTSKPPNRFCFEHSPLYDKKDYKTTCPDCKGYEKLGIVGWATLKERRRICRLIKQYAIDNPNNIYTDPATKVCADLLNKINRT
jgi:hypothetical protein